MEHKLELLGIGAAKDRELKNHLLEAIQQLGVDISIDEVREIDRLLAYGITGIPALILDGKVLFQQVVPSVDDLRMLLSINLNCYPEPLHIRTIVVPTDFSETAQNAYQYALQLANGLGAKVRLVHINQHSPDIGSPVLFDGVPEEIHYKQELLESWSQKKTWEGKQKSSTSPQVTPEMVNGFVIDELRAISKRKDTDLIVMGATGENKLLGRFLGGISSEVARKAFCPVLLVPRHSTFSGFEKIVYASNYQSKEERTLKRIISLATHFNAALHLVHVDTGSASQKNTEEVHLGVSHSAAPTALFLSHITNPDVLDALMNYTDEKKASLMAMSTVHRPFLEDTFRHNLTRDMALLTHIPLLILHAED